MSGDDDIFISRQIDALITDIFTSTEFLNFVESIRTQRNSIYELDLFTDEDIDDDIEFVFDYDSIMDGAVEELQNSLVSFEHFYYQKETKSKGEESKEDAKEESKEEDAKEENKESAEEEEKNKECSICLIDFENNDEVVLLKCKHLFHHSCIIEWAHHKKDCPNCREKF